MRRVKCCGAATIGTNFSYNRAEIGTDFVTVSAVAVPQLMLRLVARGLVSAYFNSHCPAAAKPHRVQQLPLRLVCSGIRLVCYRIRLVESVPIS